MRPFTRLAASLTVTALLAGCSDPEKSKREHFDNAEKFMAAGKTQEAIVEYRNALRDDDKFGEARFKLAQAYRTAGNQNQAYREFIRAADLLPQNNEAQISAARYLVAAGSFEDAKTRIQPVIDRDPTNAEAQLVLGSALVGLKDLDGATREIEEAIKLQPGVAAYSSLAFVKLQQGDKAQARAALEKAVEVDQRSVPARLSLAYFYWSNDDIVAAEEAYKRALAIDSKNSLANRSIAAFYAGTKRPQMAEPYMKTVADSGEPTAVLQLADYYLSMRRLSEASAVLTPLTKDAATAGDAEVRLAGISYANNDKAGAHALIDKVRARETNNTQAQIVKAQWLLLEGKAREALEPAQAAVKSNPQSAPAHFTLGLAQGEMRLRKEAMAEFGEVLRLNPRASRAQLYLSRLNLIEGSADTAVSFAESALNVAPNDPDARLSLVQGLLARRDTSRAEQEIASLLKQFPQVGIVHAVNGQLKAQKKDFAGARAEFAKALELSPKSREALSGLTALDMLENKSADARARIEKALAADPSNVEMLMMAGQIYGTLRDFPKAEAVLRKAIQNDSSASRAYALLATTLLASGKIDAARAEFDQIGQRDPKNVAARTMAAMIVHSQGKKDDAKKRYEEIVNATPTAAVAANNLAWLYQEENTKLDEALRLAQAAASRLPENAEVQDTIGMIYYKKELPALAVSAFERSIEKSPGNASYHYHLAMALAKAGEPGRARQAAQQAVKLKPDYTEAQQLLAQTKG
jgi:tetratricopeptide (TPR) repeat protein